MTLIKKFRLIVITLFWIAIYFIARSQKFEVDKNPYAMAVLFAFLAGHIYYENVYRKGKIDSKKSEIKSKHLGELKSNIKDYNPNIAIDKIPSELNNLIPIILKWGVNNKMLRENLYENAEKSELLELKSIESQKENLQEWIESNQDEEETIKAINLTLKSYDDLGLWTWE